MVHNIEMPSVEVSEDLRRQLSKHDTMKVGMTNLDIERLMGVVPNFIGVYFRDEVGKLNPPARTTRFCLIANLSPTGEIGTHWVAILVDPLFEYEVDYYDPFGREPEKEMYEEIVRLVSRLSNKYKLKFKVNKIPNQDKKTWRCGFHCCLFLLKRFILGQSFAQATGFQKEIHAKRYQTAIFRMIEQPHLAMLRTDPETGMRSPDSSTPSSHKTEEVSLGD